MATTQDHTTNLSSDIQRALQQAVGEVNNTFTQSQDISSSRKKRARSDSANFVPLDASQKKQKRKKNTDRDASASIAPPSPQTFTKDKKKKRNKNNNGNVVDKGKAREVVPDTVQVNNHGPQLVEEQTTDGHSSTSVDFLNAVVAAASATADAQHLDVSPYQAHSSYQDHHIMPNVHNHGAPPPFMSYPSMNFPFPAPAHSYGQSSSHPASLLPNLGFPLPDFQFASSDEILRALQDLDVSKLAGVLKTLGDAAAAANVPMTIPSAFVAPAPGHHNMHAPPPPQSMGHSPSTSGVVLSTAPKTTKTSHKRVLDMSLPGPDHGDPDHAHILANKWMNATKLAELVKTQGTCTSRMKTNVNSLQ
jgi:hypothetical protein